ncbi:ABC transporter ATP-binding protein [Bacillus fonticola]|uniref:ABC transporter ATP-binding protein n=1 Tax=Bacillus fonticola TaxID=2728853 RepID=UPI0014729425|nr:ABC transporter ATP-binding protein [Bacillus fonticola]
MEAAVTFQGVSKKFKDFAVEDLTFTIPKGYVTGFIGANGAGKSTTIKLLLQLIDQDQGTIQVLDMDYSKHELDIKERIGFVFDENVFYEDLTVQQMKRFIAKSYKQWDEALFQEYVIKFNLPLKRKIKKLSKGMKMKTALAFALSHHADLLIMDEPTSGLDPVMRRDLLDMFQEIMQDEEKTIFFSTHITTDLERIADFILFMDEGKLLLDCPLHEINEQYGLVKGANELLDNDTKKEFVSIRQSKLGFEALTKDVERAKELFGDEVIIENVGLEEMMYFFKKGVSA